MIYTVRSHTQAGGFHTSYLYSWVKEFAESHLLIGWQQRWQTDPQVQECFRRWQMWRFDTVWSSHTCSLNGSTFLSFYTGCAKSYTSCRGMLAATSGDSRVLLYTTSIYMWIACGIAGSNFSWFILSLYLGDRCSWVATLGYYNDGEKFKKQN